MSFELSSIADRAAVRQALGITSMVFNVQPTNLLKWRKARVVKSGVIEFIGNSTVRGQDPAGGNTQGPTAYPMQLADLFLAAGIPASADNILGVGNYYNGGNFAALLAADSRLSATGAMAAQGVESAGGLVFGCAAAGSLSFITTKQVTAFDIYAPQNAGFGTFSYSVDGAAAVNVVPTGAAGILKTTVNGLALGVHTITLAWVSGTMRVMGIVGYNDTRPEIRILNASISGAKSDGFNFSSAPNAYTRKEAQQLLVTGVSALSILECGAINDWENSYTTAQTKANIKTTIQNQKAAGSDVILLLPPYDGNVATGLTANQEAYITAGYYENAIEENVALIDARTPWGSYSAAYAAGYYATNELTHPNIVGKSDYARTIFQALMAV